MLKLLIERGRESILTSLYNDFIDIADEALGQANATVYTPFALNEKEEREIAEGFGRLTGKKIRIETVIDPSLLGGIKVRIGDRLYDGSLAGKLARLQKNLNEAQAM
jgi:F-type H+-transporting ATPase subunit delta